MRCKLAERGHPFHNRYNYMKIWVFIGCFTGVYYVCKLMSWALHKIGVKDETKNN
jgi:hypothetical protein